MWNLGKQSKGQTDLSKGIGLAVLARVVGVEEIEAEIQPFHDKIKATKSVKRPLHIAVYGHPRYEVQAHSVYV